MLFNNLDHLGLNCVFMWETQEPSIVFRTHSEHSTCYYKKFFHLNNNYSLVSASKPNKMSLFNQSIIESDFYQSGN